LLLEDFTISAASPWVHRTLAELVGDAEEVNVLAIKRGDTMLFRPPDATQLAANDALVAAGPPAAIRILESRLAAREN
jgi:uncharacterized protein with PhoU and TrkA domain